MKTRLKSLCALAFCVSLAASEKAPEKSTLADQATPAVATAVGVANILRIPTTPGFFNGVNIIAGGCGIVPIPFVAASVIAYSAYRVLRPAKEEPRK